MMSEILFHIFHSLNLSSWLCSNRKYNIFIEFKIYGSNIVKIHPSHTNTHTIPINLSDHPLSVLARDIAMFYNGYNIINKKLQWLFTSNNFPSRFALARKKSNISSLTPNANKKFMSQLIASFSRAQTFCRSPTSHTN
jgi:hypothetical protein